jgi:putative copper export protein
VHTVTLTFTEGVTGSFSKFTVSTASGATVSAGPTTLHGQTVVIPTVIDNPGKIVVSWLAVGTDFNPVRGQYLFSVTTASGGVPSPSGAGAPGAGFTQGTAGSPVWTSMIKAVRFVEVAALYAVLGILLVRVLVLKGRLDGSEADTAHLYAILLTAGFVSVVVAPMLFLLYATRLHDLSGVAVRSQVFSSVGRPWLAALVVWAGFTFAVVRFARRRPEPGDRHDRLLLGCAALATVVFVINTHAGAATPQPLWGAVMWAHVMATALWAGSLGALVLVIVPSLGPAQGQLVIERFSTVMTLTVAAIPASGILLLLKLGGSW